ncbi:MAG: hypothetical protein RLP15_00445 [Cryomorphaceae bacterium]
MTIKQIFTAWVGTLLLGSLLVPLSSDLLVALTNQSQMGSIDAFFVTAALYGVYAFFLSIPSLLFLLLIRRFLVKRLRYEHQFTAMSALTVVGVLIGTLSLGQENAAIAFTLSTIIVFQVMLRLPERRHSAWVL